MSTQAQVGEQYGIGVFLAQKRPVSASSLSDLIEGDAFFERRVGFGGIVSTD